jgi:phosphoglycerate dehydrogenase-like enzyme
VITSSAKLTAMRGLHSNPLADFAIAAILYHVKQIPRLQANKEMKNYERFFMNTVRGNNMLIIGFGDIG